MAATVDTSFKQKMLAAVEVPVLSRCCFCLPLRKGLIAFAYANLVLTAVVSCLLSLYVSSLRQQHPPLPAVTPSPDAPTPSPAPPEELPRLVVDITGLVLELAMTLVFIVALHKKQVLLMKVYLYFELTFSLVGFIYSVAFMTAETASELFLILFQLTIQIYLVILIWSSIVKMERDGSVKYVRDRETV